MSRVYVRDMQHGTLAGYINRNRCACADCLAAWKAYSSQPDHRNAIAALSSSHGQYSTYVNDRCRCVECKAANAEYGRERYARRKRQRASRSI